MKKMANRILSVIMALIMLMSMFSVAVSADNEQKTKFKYSVSGTIKIGNEFSLVVSAENVKSLKSATLDIIFYPNLELVNVSSVGTYDFVVESNSLENANNCGISRNQIQFSKAVSGNVDFITLTFKIVDMSYTKISISQIKWDSSDEPDDAVVDINDFRYKGEASESSSNTTKLEYVIDNNEVTITDCDLNTSGEVVIPDTIEGCPVTAIDRIAFSSCRKITSIVIPDSVTTIGEEAFMHCVLLDNVVLPSKLTVINSATFYMCENLKNVVIPDSVTKICDNAFYGCVAFANVNFPKNLTEIGSYAFADSGLTSINIPEGVTYIGNYAFSSTKIKSVVIPNSMTVLSDSIFRNCDNLKEITIPKTVKIIKPFAFCDCDCLQEVVIPVNVTEIGGYAFSYETGFTPKGITIYGLKGSAAQIYADNNWEAIFVELKENKFNFDVDGNGSITTVDARIALRASVSLENLSGLSALAADVDANGKITVSDARMILRKAAGLE